MMKGFHFYFRNLLSVYVDFGGPFVWSACMCDNYDRPEGFCLRFLNCRIMAFWGPHSTGRHKGLYCCYRAARYHAEWKE